MVAAGAAHSLALRADGSLVQWGDNEVNERANMPAASERFAVVAAGLYHSLARCGWMAAWFSGATRRWARAGDAVGFGPFHDDLGGRVPQRRPSCGWNVCSMGRCAQRPAEQLPREHRAIHRGLVRRVPHHCAASGRNAGSVERHDAGAGQQQARDDRALHQKSAGKLHNLALRADGSLAQWASSLIEQMNNAPGSGDASVRSRRGLPQPGDSDGRDAGAMGSRGR